MLSKGHVCSFGKGWGAGEVRLSIAVVEPLQPNSTAEHFAFWRLFQMQWAGLGGNQGHGADVVIAYVLCNRHQMGAGNLITLLLLCLCASLCQQNIPGTVPRV